MSSRNAPTRGITRKAFGEGPKRFVTAFLFATPTGVAPEPRVAGGHDGGGVVEAAEAEDHEHCETGREHHLEGQYQQHASERTGQLPEARDLVPDHARMHRRLGRLRLHLRDDRNASVSEDHE
jgi:hypothetical protein